MVRWEYMGSFHKKARFSRNKSREKRNKRIESGVPEQQGDTGAEAAYLKSSVESRALVTVVLKSGERLRGRVRYYDQDCFSLGPALSGPNIFLRKSSVLYISEE